MLNNAGIDRITQLKLNDINWTIKHINELQSLVKLQEKLGINMSLSGIIHITGNWSTIERDYYGGTPSSIWPGLEFDTTQDTSYLRTFCDTYYAADKVLPKKDNVSNYDPKNELL